MTETQWPSAGITPQIWRLDGANRLSLSTQSAHPAEAPAALTVGTRLETGLDCGAWCPYGAPGDWAANRMDAYESINGAEAAVFGRTWQTSVSRNGA